ncbi:efflux RND transporter permease subunit [Chromatiaceae bacterium AAb-1]|nr:efflux RND transporter permease subunit [Chromatiaceae bacterium AAb-1]
MINLSALAVRERAVTLFLLLLSIYGGVHAFFSMGRAEDPSFAVRVMIVSAIWPGASPQDMQDQVVDKLEKRIQEVRYLYRIETKITAGRADLLIEFHDYSPPKEVHQLFYEVRKRMQDEAANLPQGVLGPFVNDDFADVYFSLISLTAPKLPKRELSREAERLRDRLYRLPGVHKALIMGEQAERVYLELDNDKLVNLGISPQQVFEAIEAHNTMAPAGRIESGGPRVYLRTDNSLGSPEKLGLVPLRIGERIITLNDIAVVRRGYEDPPSFVIRAFGEEALLLAVVMEPGGNGLELGERLEQLLQQEQQHLPLGMELHILTNQAEAIAGAVNLFQVKFLVAVLVVLVVSILAIGFRAGLVVGIAIPVTLGLTFMMMQMLNINLDRVTLGALIIALGLLVDDAIIATEMMMVKIEEGMDKISAAAYAWKVTAAPMLFGTLVTVAGFVPIGFAKSATGEYTGNIFWVLACALLVSWLVAVTFTPYLGVKLLPASLKKHDDGVYNSPGYQRLRSLIRYCVEHRKKVVAATVLLLVLSVVGMAGPVKKQFFPSSDRPEILVNVYLPKGSAFSQTDETVRQLEQLLHDRPGVRTLASYIGGGAPRFFISLNPEQPDSAFAELVVVADDVTAREQLISFLDQQIADGAFPQARVNVKRILYGPPVKWPVSFRILGPDMNKLRLLGHQVRAVMEKYPGTRDVHLDWDERTTVLYLNMDPQALQMMGLTPLDVSQQLQVQLDGARVSESRQDIRTVAIYARGDTRSLDGLKTLEIKNQDGRKVPLMQLAELEIRFEEPVIRRYNREPVMMVQAEVVANVQAPDVEAALWRQLADFRAALPDGYSMEISGTIEQSGKANESIEKLGPVMIVLMLIFIMLQMRSFSGTFMVLATAPLGLIGAVAALLLFNQPFGFVALLGLIGLAGILMRNTLILTQQVSDNMQYQMPMADAIIEAAVHRARPVILTALAAAFAFVPLALDSFWGPLAYVLIGGVIAGTVITLLFVPALYALWFRLKS